MAKQRASEIETLFSLCSAIAFRSDEDNEVMPTIILGFDDEISGPVAFNALKKWAKDGELMIALQNKKEYIDATLIHSGSYEAIIISQLTFDDNNFSEFVSKVSQDRKVAMCYCKNPMPNHEEHIAVAAYTLFRYILVTTNETQQG